VKVESEKAKVESEKPEKLKRSSGKGKEPEEKKSKKKIWVLPATRKRAERVLPVLYEKKKKSP